MLNNELIQDALQKMDRELLSHCVQAKSIATVVGKELNLDIRLLETAALLHDIGKILIPQSVLNKPGSLTEIEREVVDLHSYIGYHILKDMDFDDGICEIVLYHHGRDKPALKPKPPLKEKAELYADVLRTIDAYDALTSDRPYRDKYTEEEAIQILKHDTYSNVQVLAVLEKYKP